MPTNALRRTLVEALIAILIFGSIPVVVKFISANTYTIGIARLAIALFLMFFLVRGKGYFKKLGLKDWRALAWIGLFFGLHWLTYFQSIKISSASIGAIGLSSYGIHLLLLSRFFQKTKLQLANIAAVFVAILGNLLIIPEYSLENDTTIGLLLGILSGFFYATLPLIHQRYSDIPSNLRAFGQFLFAFVLFLFFLPQSSWSLSRLDWYGLAYLAIAVTVIAHTLWVRVTTTLSTSTTSIIYYGYVPTALLFSYFILEEQLDAQALLGAALIISASIFGLAYQVKTESLMK